MSFEVRNAAWGGSKRYFRQLQSRGSAPRVWNIQVDGNIITTEYGQLGGAMQTVTDALKGINIGKKNEIGPEKYALARAKETCRKKHLEGYSEFDAVGNALDEAAQSDIDFDNLPQNLCFYKPENTMSSGLLKKAKTGQVWYTRKRDGLAYIIAKGNGKAKLYSRRMFRQHDDETNTQVTWDDRFPYIIESFDAIMPPNSIILGELVFDRSGKDDAPQIESYVKSLTATSVADQEKNGPASFYVWDIAFWNGEDWVSQKSVDFRFSLIHELSAKHIIPIEILTHFATPEEAVEHAKEMKWEGYVVVDPSGVYGDKAYNFKGKPDRPGSACCKLKPEYEDDFIAIWNPSEGHGEFSTKGRYGEAGIKSVALYQYNNKGERVFICNVASGLKEEMKRDWADGKLYPQVWKIGYSDRRYVSQGDKSNALDFPKFLAVRTDKTASECINPKL